MKKRSWWRPVRPSRRSRNHHRHRIKFRQLMSRSRRVQSNTRRLHPISSPPTSPAALRPAQIRTSPLYIFPQKYSALTFPSRTFPPLFTWCRAFPIAPPPFADLQYYYYHRRGHPRGSKVVPLNSWGRGSYWCSIVTIGLGCTVWPQCTRVTINQPTTNDVTTQPISISASFTKVK